MARTKAEREAHQDFRELVLAEPCLFSRTRPEHSCSGVRDPHHVIRQAWLRREFPGVWNVVYDPELGVALCRAAHDQVTTHFTRVFFEELPARVVDRAEALGIRYKLEHSCPSLTSERSEIARPQTKPRRAAGRF